MRYIIQISSIIYILTFTPLPLHAQNNCIEHYPSYELMARMDKETYRACEVTTMVADYTSFLDEQLRLLQTLRSAYIRKLEADLEANEQQIYLKEFDVQLNKLTVIKNSLPGTIGQESYDSLHSLIKIGRDSSRALKRKIIASRDMLSGEEQQQYCKLDFYFKLTKELRHKIVECITMPNE